MELPLALNTFRLTKCPLHDIASNVNKKLSEKKHLEDARKTLQAAFPEKYKHLEAKEAFGKKEAQGLDTLLRGLTTMVTYSRAEIAQSQLVSERLPLLLINSVSKVIVNSQN